MTTKITNSKMLFLIAIIAFTGFSQKTFAQGATFTDHGNIPIGSIKTGNSGYSEFQNALVYNNHVWVATDSGLWKNNLTTKAWSLVGLPDKKITFVFKHSSNKLFAGALIGPFGRGNTNPLYVSLDDGATWNPVTSPVNENYEMISERPGNPNHLYASMEGYDFAVSTNGGNSWVFFNGGPGGSMGYPVCTAFLPSNPDKLFFGSENPLDDAWLGKYTINDSNPTQLDNFAYVVQGGQLFWDNRRPNRLKTYTYTGNTIYVGQEGALSKVNSLLSNSTTYIYKSEGEPTKPYSYMYGHWVDPTNTNHLVFGGSRNGNNAGLFQLYETFNEGTTFYRYTDTFGLSSTSVTNILDIGGGKLGIVICDQDNNKVKLVVMQLATLSIIDNEFSKSILIFPNPTSDILQIESKEYNITTIKITNNIGQVVLQQNLNAQKAKISIGNLESGLYYIELQTKEGLIATKKIIKE